MLNKEQVQAANDAEAAKIYKRLTEVVGEVFSERGKKREEAIKLACELVTGGYSLRKAAKAAGFDKADNRLQRYFEVAKAMLSHEEGEEGKVIAPPDGFQSWSDAIAAMPLDNMCEHIRASKTGKTVTVDPDKAVRKHMDSHLNAIAALIDGSAKGKAVEGLSVGEAQAVAYVKAWLENGFKVAPDMPLSAQTAETTGILAAIRNPVTAVVEMIEPVAVNQ